MSVESIVTIFRCDGKTCASWKGVNLANEIDEFCDLWFVGTDVHFCNICKVKPENQAAIEAQTFDMDAMSQRITERVLMQKEVA